MTRPGGSNAGSQQGPASASRGSSCPGCSRFAAFLPPRRAGPGGRLHGGAAPGRFAGRRRACGTGPRRSPARRNAARPRAACPHLPAVPPRRNPERASAAAAQGPAPARRNALAPRSPRRWWCRWSRPAFPPGASRSAAWRSSRRCRPTRGCTFSPCQSSMTRGCFSHRAPAGAGRIKLDGLPAAGPERQVLPLVGAGAHGQQVAGRACWLAAWQGGRGRAHCPARNRFCPPAWARKPVLLPGLAQMSSTLPPAAGSRASGGSMEERSWM